jgi:hypothetical protein
VEITSLKEATIHIKPKERLSASQREHLNLIPTPSGRRELEQWFYQSVSFPILSNYYELYSQKAEIRLLIKRFICIASKFARDGDKRPAVPKKDEKPIMGLVSDKNFIVANAVENILAGNDIFSHKL